MIAPRAHAVGRRAASPVRWRGRDEFRDRDTAEALGHLVAGIGAAEFPARFLAVMHALAGVELCSVFRRDGAEGVQLLFAAGDPAQQPDFALSASRDYARSHWRSDAQLTRLARARVGEPVVVRRHVSEIADPAYRAACYERAGVVERISILWPGRPAFVANGYRTAPGAPFAPQDVERLELHARLLLAALRQHLRADTATGYLFDEIGLAERLAALDYGLSAREAEIAASLVLGETQERIAEAKRLSLATVITYRRRAYAKLGVANRRELAALHRRLMAEPDEKIR